MTTQELLTELGFEKYSYEYKRANTILYKLRYGYIGKAKKSKYYYEAILIENIDWIKGERGHIQYTDLAVPKLKDIFSKLDIKRRQRVSKLKKDFDI